MMYFKGSSMSELYPRILGHVLENGEAVSPRGMDTVEVSPLVFELTNPEDCLVLQKARRLNYAFVVAERLALLSGTADPDMLCFYIDRLRCYVNESTGCFDGAYGPRIRPQLDYVFEELRRDPNSRRAVVSVFGPQDQRPSLDVPCTLTLQFLLRHGRLDLVVNMRSSDLYLGLPYDVSQFAFLQQTLAGWLGLPTGRYIQWAASGHIYAQDLRRVRVVLENPGDLHMSTLTVPRLTRNESVHQYEVLLRIEENLRSGDELAARVNLDALIPALQDYAAALNPGIRSESVTMPV